MRNDRFMHFTTLALFASAAALLATGCSDNPILGEPSGSGEPGPGALLVLGSTVNGNSALYRFSLDGTESKVIAKAIGSTAWLSANGSRIAARRTWDGLIFLDPNGDNVTTLDLPNILTWSPGELHISISPSGHYIAYFMDAVEPEQSIYVAPTDGRGGELLFTGTVGFWEWSGVDDKLAFGGIGVPLRIYDPDTKTMVDVTSSLGTGITTDATWWSPDGQRLVFIEDLPNAIVLASVDKQGQDRRVLLPNLSTTPGPRQGQWSPDGQNFALVEPINKNFDRQLRLVDANGIISRQIIDDIDVFNPGWAPTNHFVYVKTDDAIKSVQLSGTTMDLVSPTPLGGSRLSYIGSNGRVLYADYPSSTVGAVGADGSIPITYQEKAPHQLVQLSEDGAMVTIVAASTPDGKLPLHAASSASSSTTLVLSLIHNGNVMFMRPIERGGGVVFDGEARAGWILTTNTGFNAFFPRPSLGHIGWACLVE